MSTPTAARPSSLSASNRCEGIATSASPTAVPNRTTPASSSGWSKAYPEADVIRLVQDNLNTHLPGSLYDAFEPSEARRLLRKLEFHYTPVHGSWLNMAEIEIAIIGKACLRRRVGDRATLERHLAALEAERNAQERTITWSFTAYDARKKLRRLYPIPEPETGTERSDAAPEPTGSSPA